MKRLFLAKIKQFIKRIFPFIKYRWHIYEAFKKFLYFLYHRSPELLTQKDLLQKVNFSIKYKLKIETVNETNRVALVEFAEKNYNKNMYRNWVHCFFKNHYDGFIAYFQGKIIGYIWWWADNRITKPPPEVIFYNINLENGGVYGFNFFIAPQYRGSGNAIEFLSRVFLELKKCGYNRISGIHGRNYLPADWIYKIVGFKEIKSLSWHNFFNRIAYYEKAVFIKNSLRHTFYPFEYRLICSFRNIF